MLTQRNLLVLMNHLLRSNYLVLNILTNKAILLYYLHVIKLL